MKSAVLFNLSLKRASRYGTKMGRSPLWTALLLLILATAVNAVQFYQPVKGNCSQLHEIGNYEDRKVATGQWYDHYTSFGHDGEKCVTARLMNRETKTYLEYQLFDPTRNTYVAFTDDLDNHPEKPGLYTTSSGATLYVLAEGSNDNAFVIQCLEQNDETKVDVLFATRGPQLSEQAEKTYQKYAAFLKKRQLLPKMFRISFENCPPVDSVVYEKIN